MTLEETLPAEPNTKYPRCTAGRRACPPEDCGGIPGYQNMLQILADRTHEEYKETLTWVGGSYDPDHFNPSQVRFDNPRKRWNTAFGGG